MKTKKLQNFFNTFLPQNYREFRQSFDKMTANQAVVASLLKTCCDDDDVKAIEIAFERTIGKPEKVIVIKRTLVRTIFPDAKTKFDQPPIIDQVEDEVAVRDPFADKVIIAEEDAPGFLLQKMLDKIGELGKGHAFDVLDKKDKYTVAEVVVANLYAIAIRGSNLRAISMLFDYLDGTVADVVRIDGEDVLQIENYANVAPYEAQMAEDGVFYVETEAVR